MFTQQSRTHSICSEEQNGKASINDIGLQCMHRQLDTPASKSNTYSVSGNTMAILLLLFLVGSQAINRQCSNAAVFHSCDNNPVLRVTKSTDMYQVTLQATEWQCYNDFCLVNDQKYRQKNIMCNETCRACKQLKPRTGNGNGTLGVYARKARQLCCSAFCLNGIGVP